jgi:uncharacterized membrane protein
MLCRYQRVLNRDVMIPSWLVASYGIVVAMHIGTAAYSCWAIQFLRSSSRDLCGATLYTVAIINVVLVFITIDSILISSHPSFMNLITLCTLE